MVFWLPLSLLHQYFSQIFHVLLDITLWQATYVKNNELYVFGFGNTKYYVIEYMQDILDKYLLVFSCVVISKKLQNYQYNCIKAFWNFIQLVVSLSMMYASTAGATAAEKSRGVIVILFFLPSHNAIWIDVV